MVVGQTGALNRRESIKGGEAIVERQLMQSSYTNSEDGTYRPVS